MLNRVVINDLEVEDQSGEKMLKVARVSASINYLSLIDGVIEIPTAQLFSATARLNCDSVGATPNFQFLLDAFKSEKKEESKTPHLRINSLIVRHTNVNFDIKSVPSVVVNDSVSRFNPSHIALTDFGMNFSLKNLSDDSLNISVKRLGGRERNSGLTISDLSFAIEANRRTAVLTDLNLRTLRSSLNINKVRAHYNLEDSASLVDVDDFAVWCMVNPSEFCSFVPVLKNMDTSISLMFNAELQQGVARINRFALNSSTYATSLVCNAFATLESGYRLHDASLSVTSFSVGSRGTWRLSNDLRLGTKVSDVLAKVGDINIQAGLTYDLLGLTTKGTLATSVGEMDFSADMDTAKSIALQLEAKDVQLSRLLDKEGLGTAGITATASGTLSQLSSAQISANVSNASEALTLHADYSNLSGIHSLKADADIDNVNIGKFVAGRNESYTLNLKSNLRGSSVDDLLGEIDVADLSIMSENDTVFLDRLQISSSGNAQGRHYQLSSDFCDMEIDGRFSISRLPASVVSMLSAHFPHLFKGKHVRETHDASLQYTMRVSDHPILHHFLPELASLNSSITSHGNIFTDRKLINAYVNAPQLSYGSSNYRDISLRFHSTPVGVAVDAAGISEGKKSNMQLNLTAMAANDLIDANIKADIDGTNSVLLDMNASAQFTDSIGKLLTKCTIKDSELAINDTLWQIYPGRVDIFGKELSVSGVGVKSGEKYVTVNGKASSESSDSIVAELKDIDVNYVLDIVRFKTVRFNGHASGTAVVKDVMGSPDLFAHLFVSDFYFQGGRMGDADITGRWDNKQKSILLDAHIVDHYRMPIDLAGNEKDFMGITDVHGFVSPANKELRLDIRPNNTHLDFLNGFVGGIFNEIEGNVSGALSVVGPFSNVNLIGNATATANLSLRATDVPYHIENQFISFREGLFDFSGITLTDKNGKEGLLNGKLAHRNFGRLAYNFDVGFSELLLYDQKEFNSDKFLATVYGQGTLSVEGKDDHPLYINATVTPTRGSVFAYDAASPDAITSSSFITMRDKSKVQEEEEAASVVNGDMYINFNLNLDNNCEIRLRMDNKPDGYISTFGHANLQARYYNKSGLQLFGNYNIDSGSYRLYLQDLIFKDLKLQPGSKVEFNGAPFDANIHLVCHHTINSVPLSDLTATRAFSQSNKARVICILDITGTLDNMNFTFGLSLPNVNDEVRQLVRSMINSEEEMNTQMIYLLAFSRFYPTGIAGANAQAGDVGTSAVNSLVSSTLSGQINNFLSTIMGPNSNWSVGTGISTGERGWQDLDVEGTLSGRLFDDRLLINGNFGYRDNVMTNRGTFIGDFEVKWRIKKNGGKFYLKAYNQTNDRYFTKATLNTQGIGISFQHDFESWRTIFKRQPRLLPLDTSLPADSIK